jgi:hypothetical protein
MKFTISQLLHDRLDISDEQRRLALQIMNEKGHDIGYFGFNGYFLYSKCLGFIKQ